MQAQLSTAWEVTEEDIANVLSEHEIKNEADKLAANLLVEIDTDRISKAALYSTDFDEQCEYARNEIKEILRENGIIHG